MEKEQNVRVTKKDLNLTKLPYLLVIAQVDDLKGCAHAIMEIILFTKDAQFFSYSESKDEISLIMDENTLSKFPKDLLKISPKKYYALEVSGPLGASAVGIIHSVTEPLANENISIFYFSTYQTDYTLIAEKDLNRALSCLAQHFTLRSEDIHGQSDLMKIPKVLNSTKSLAIPHTEQLQFEEKCTPKKLSLHKQQPLSLISLDKDDPFLLGAYLLQLIFFTEKKEGRFFSYHESNGTISMILPKNEMSPILHIQGTDYVRVYDHEFARITIDGPSLGFEESGIVDSIAAPLANGSISLFYLSTYDTAHVLVTMASSINAQKALKERFEITLK